MRCLDLFCGAGGAGMGYHRAGFEVVGVDIKPQPHYPFEFHRADALEYLAEHGRGFDFIHASPPCQKFSAMQHIHKNRERHPDLIAKTRELLRKVGQPYVIENVPGAPLLNPIVLCGTMFGLKIIKHRYFESPLLPFSLFPPCDHSDTYDPWHGKAGKRTAAKFRDAMGIDWIPMGGGDNRRRGRGGDLSNAIPSAYTEFIGKQIIKSLQ